MIHILGNVGVDLSMGPVDRLPSWGTEILAGASVYRPGGAAVNAALALAGLYAGGLTLAELEGEAEPLAGAPGHAAAGAPAGGAAPAAPGHPAAGAPATTRPPVPVQVYCPVGADREGRDLRALLARAGLGVEHVEPVAGATTSLGLALVRADGERAFVSDLGSLRLANAAWVGRALAGVTGPGWVLFTGMTLFPELPPEVLAELFDWLRAKGLQVALDTGWDPADWPPERVAAWREVVARTDLFLPNELEARALTGCTDPTEAARRLQGLSGRTVLVKVGPDGCWAASPAGLRHFPTRPAPVPDTTGAGDLFDAGVLYGLEAGWPLEQAVLLGHRVAGAVLQGRRSRFPGVQELVASGAAGA